MSPKKFSLECEELIPNQKSEDGVNSMLIDSMWYGEKQFLLRKTTEKLCSVLSKKVQ